MAICYNKLWKMLIDKHMSKTQLIKEAKISTNAMARLGKNKDVRVEVLVKICSVLGCTIDDISFRNSRQTVFDSLCHLLHLRF